MKQIRAGLVGVTGYTGMELTRLLETHPNIRLTQVTSRSEAGKPLKAFYPFLQGLRTGELLIAEANLDSLAANCDVVFLAVPHGTAMETAAALRARDVAVVDLSADYRLRDKTVFAEWYKSDHTQPEVLAEAVYGLPEIYGEELKTAKMVANPGCYPTASILALYPALAKGFIESDGIVIDAKSGTSGAGRKASTGTLYCEVADSLRAYNLTKHRHTPEIEQELALAVGKNIAVSFNPHLLPVNRGILATNYAAMQKGRTLDEVHALYEEWYAEHPFVRVLPKGSLPELRNVRGTMFCDIGMAYDPRVNKLILLSAIDNLCRGASGQAIANANIMNGLPVETGLLFAPMVP